MAFLKTRNAQSRPALCRHRQSLQAARRNLARAVGLRLLPDGGGDQLPHLPQAATAAGATSIPSRTTSPASARPAAACPATAIPDVNTGVLAQIQHLVVYSGEHIDDPVGARTTPEAGRHHRNDGEQEGSHHLRRPVAPLGRRPPLRCIDRMGGEQLPPIVLQGHRPRRGDRDRHAQAGEARRRSDSRWRLPPISAVPRNRTCRSEPVQRRSARPCARSGRRPMVRRRPAR